MQRNSSSKEADLPLHFYFPKTGTKGRLFRLIFIKREIESQPEMNKCFLKIHFFYFLCSTFPFFTLYKQKRKR